MKKYKVLVKVTTVYRMEIFANDSVGAIKDAKNRNPQGGSFVEVEPPVYEVINDDFDSTN